MIVNPGKWSVVYVGKEYKQTLLSAHYVKSCFTGVPGDLSLVYGSDVSVVTVQSKEFILLKTTRMPTGYNLPKTQS